MKMTKKLMAMMIAVAAAMALTSCDPDPEPTPSGDEGGGAAMSGVWYVAPGGFGSASDLNEINEAIDNHELLSSYRYDGATHNHYAEVSEFIDDNGGFNNVNSGLGRLRFTGPACQVQLIRIVDDSTLETYGAWLYQDCGSQNYEGNPRVYRFDGGRHFGPMAYYANLHGIYVYIKKNNTITVSNGDIYLVTSEGLKSGSGVYTTFRPSN